MTAIRVPLANVAIGGRPVQGTHPEGSHHQGWSVAGSRRLGEGRLRVHDSHLDRRRRGYRLLDLATLRCADDGVAVLHGERGGQAQLEADAARELRGRIDVDVLAEPQAIGRDVPRLAEPQDVETRARGQGRQEEVEGPDGTALAPLGGGLVGMHDKRADARVDSLATGKGYVDRFHARWSLANPGRVHGFSSRG